MGDCIAFSNDSEYRLLEENKIVENVFLVCNNNFDPEKKTAVVKKPCKVPALEISDSLDYSMCITDSKNEIYFGKCQVKTMENFFIEKNRKILYKEDIICSDSGVSSVTKIEVHKITNQCNLEKIDNGSIKEGCIKNGNCFYYCNFFYVSEQKTREGFSVCLSTGFNQMPKCSKNTWYYVVFISFPILFLVVIGVISFLFTNRKKKKTKKSISDEPDFEILEIES
ncbi:hypothetical protein MHBO_001779 [Bonamia ostreae]|uniref:Uncharacterized protein n=1 Tax=Bonamia ostreae TaxID=126728 RepID=A0ABV2AKS7_9EUKA